MKIVKLRKKAMDPGQIFIYALSLFIVGFILIYGYMVISEFIGSSSDVEFLKFQKELEKVVKSYTTEFGSSSNVELSAPGSVISMCFTDYYSILTSMKGCNSSTFSSFNPIIKDSYQSSPREMKNVFLINPDDEVVKSFFLGNISLVPNVASISECNYLCANFSSGNFKFKIKGKGIGVSIGYS